MKMVSVRFGDEDISELQKIAHSKQLNVSSVIRLIINDFLNKKDSSINLISNSHTSNSNSNP